MLKNKILFITNNIHKYNEVKPIARKYGFEIEQYRGYKVEIQSNDLIDIARYAAFHAYLAIKKPLLVEDAGLFIKALNGFPGPYSSYVYRTIGYNGILKLMKNIEEREAYFISAAVLIYEPYILIDQARVDGYIAINPRGDKGFGFDPIFIPNGIDKTFAEMCIEEKNKYSHRARVVEKIFSRLSTLVRSNDIEKYI